MKMITKLGLLLLCAMVIDTKALSGFPRNWNSHIECTNSLQCAPGHCCTISATERYSYPRCQKLHEVGDYCRAEGPLLTNDNVTYPDGSKSTDVHLEDVYLLFCPCAPGLVCDSDERICRQPSDMKDFNYLKEQETGSNKSDD
ncbi:hypothetical protein TSAR_016792 [Trichomalopsis sarcophagae]|uniref:Prokineticin domain-containing protein n=1 Tax=Trichomalopsis sarcophagae TaxID=543379 RepID=A0A232EWP4_9HYME|nr:hypothetical protein TSAR_016792 [Trichomalopsis sarcophagae]